MSSLSYIQVTAAPVEAVAPRLTFGLAGRWHKICARASAAYEFEAL